MRGLKIITLLILFIAFLSEISNANDYQWTDNGYVMNWTSGNLAISSSQWSAIDKLQTYNDVTVTMSGGGANQFYMYNNSSLTQYGGSINYLYLYGNVSASFFGSSYMNTLYIDPVSTATVKIYGSLDQMSLNWWSDPLHVSSGTGTISGNFLSGGTVATFHFNLSGNNSFSHIQFIPEPASVLLIGLGCMFVRLKKNRH